MTRSCERNNDPAKAAIASLPRPEQVAGDQGEPQADDQVHRPDRQSADLERECGRVREPRRERAKQTLRRTAGSGQGRRLGLRRFGGEGARRQRRRLDARPEHALGAALQGQQRSRLSESTRRDGCEDSGPRPEQRRLLLLRRPEQPDDNGSRQMPISRHSPIRSSSATRGATPSEVSPVRWVWTSRPRRSGRSSRRVLRMIWRAWKRGIGTNGRRTSRRRSSA